ncbi:hypothetical protein [Lutibacter sp.]|uniref:hypothetical protein n=1 Tax=Lutibacter sp. TaxID=1925666 RepID=UPI003561D0B6
MKTSYFMFILLLLFNLTSFNSNAQQTDENTYIINQYFQLNNESALLENKRTPTTNNNKQEQSNFITLNQIGNNNEIDIKQNVADSQTVSQLGNNNYYNFINYYNNTPSNFNIIQQGNANNLQIYGENSIINNISIIQKSDFKTLIIKNY